MTDGARGGGEDGEGESWTDGGERRSTGLGSVWGASTVI